MYIPAHFRSDDPAELRALMGRHSFALLITTDADGLPFVTHQPLLHQASGGPHGQLVGHIARANPQWQHFANGKPVLAVFQGPHAYVSPGWYRNHPAVPTWNYIAVHAYGTPRIIADQAAVRRLLDRLVQTYESGLPSPWSIGDEPDSFISGMQQAIVAFEIPIDRLEGKLKLSQNRKPEDRVGAIAGLRAQGGAENLATAAAMEKLLD